LINDSNRVLFCVKEMSKSWVNVVSNEVVYAIQVFEREARQSTNFVQRVSYVDDYLRSNIWLEFILRIRRGMHLDLYVALVEAFEPIHEEPLGAFQSSGNIDLGHSGQDQAVLVNIVDSVKNPQRMPSSFPIWSVVRLHRLDVGSDVFSQAFEYRNEFLAILDEDGKGSERVLFDGERPCDVIQGRSEGVGNLPYQDSPRARETLCEIRAEDIAPILRVFIDTASVMGTCDEGSHFTVEAIQMFLRPIDSSEGGSHWFHNENQTLNVEGKDNAI
jgi:hypothetical protein